LESHRVQNKLLAQAVADASAARTITEADERGGGLSRLRLLSGAQAHARQWVGFEPAELRLLLDAGGLTVQRFARRDLVMKT